MSAFAAKMEEDRQRREAEKTALNAKLRETHALNVRLAIIARKNVNPPGVPPPDAPAKKREGKRQP